MIVTKIIVAHDRIPELDPGQYPMIASLFFNDDYLVKCLVAKDYKIQREGTIFNKNDQTIHYRKFEVVDSDEIPHLLKAMTELGCREIDINIISTIGLSSL